MSRFHSLPIHLLPVGESIVGDDIMGRNFFPTPPYLPMGIVVVVPA